MYRVITIGLHSDYTDYYRNWHEVKAYVDALKGGHMVVTVDSWSELGWTRLAV